MIPIETISLIFAASIALALTPGPDNIFVLTQSAVHGPKAGLLITLGLCTGLLVHTSAVTLGLAAIFQTSALAFNLVKLTGVLYLLYLAWQIFHNGPMRIDEQKSIRMKWHRLYFRGILMNISNPKVAIFFLAFLPQFTAPSQGPIAIQMLILGGLFIIATLITFGAIAWAAGFIGVWLKQSMRTQVVINRIAGTVFIGLAARLAISER